MSAQKITGQVTTPRLGVRLLGHVELDVDGSPFRLATPRRALSLLTYLALNRHRAVERDSLAFLLWPDEEEGAARTKLRGSLFDLTRVLPPRADGWFDADKSNIAWRDDADVEVDVERFEVLARDPATLREAVELYRGELAASLYDEWIDEPRERMRNLYLASLTRLVADARRVRDFPLAISSARRILAIDPWREDIVRRVMALHYESGDRAGALAEYRRFSERLRTEMDVEPMPETQMVMESILRETEVFGSPSDLDADSLARPKPAAALPFVGREEDLARILDCAERAARGVGQLVGIGGEAGIGKSRLAREIVDAVEERGGRVMWGTTGRPESAPYEPLVDSLRSALPLLSALPLAPNVAPVLAALVPELFARIPDMQPLVPLDPQAERQRLFEALGTAFALLAKARPIVLVLEDLHCAGEATLEAVGFVAQRLRSTRSTIVVTYREEETPRNHPLRRLLREGGTNVTTLSLGPIGVDAVEALMQSRPEIAYAPQLVHERAGGNPLFLVQLLSGEAALTGGALPATLASLIAERLATLSPDAATLAEVAAAIGERFSLDVVRDVLGWHDGDTLRAIDELIDRRIVRERGGRGLFPYAFDHQLIGQAIAEASPPERRVARHRRIATVLDALFPDRKEELAGEIARHYDRGNEPVLAVDRYMSAAKYATSLGAIDEANGFIGRGLELVSEDRTRIELLLVREFVGYMSGATPAHLATLDELTRLAQLVGDSTLNCDVLARRANFMFRHADNAAQRRANEALHAEATRAGEVGWLARADLLESFRLELVAGADEALAAGTRARDAFLAAGDLSGASEAASERACILADSGRFPEARAALEEALSFAERAGSYVAKKQAFFAATNNAMVGGEYAEMLAVGERWLAHADAAGDSRAAVRAKGQIAIAQLLLLELGAALRTFDETIALAEELGLPRVHDAHLLNRGILLATIGDLPAAAVSLERSASLSAMRSDERSYTTARAEQCVVRAHMGQFERALSAGREAHANAAPHGFVEREATALENLAETEFLMGNLDEARARASESLALRIATGSAHRVGSTRALAGRFALAAGDVESARETLETLAPDDPVTFEGALWPERVAWDAACISHATGRTTDASRWLARAHGLMTRMRASVEDRPELVAAFDSLPWRAQIDRAKNSGTWPDR
jgi:DNA-binding SARP family transcriptional activator/tetratricopeptide (TPR) repeat protein